MRLLVAAVLAAFGLAAPAQAAVELGVATAPDRIDVGGTRSVTYAVSVRNTGDAEERFSFQAPSVPFAPGEGAAMVPRADITAQGATLLGPGSTLIGEIPACVHGLAPEDRAWDVAVAPGAAGTLQLAYDVAPAARWRTTRYRPLFTLASHLGDGSRGTLTADVRVRAPAPRVTGDRGVRITLDTDPSTNPSGSRGVAKVGAGDPIDVSGRTIPALRRARITIVVDPEGARARTVSVRTDARGRFALEDLTLDRPGATLVSARSHRAGGRIVGDFTCPLAFDVG